MNDNELKALIDSKFKSGNSLPVDRIVLTREEYDNTRPQDTESNSAEWVAVSELIKVFEKRESYCEKTDTYLLETEVIDSDDERVIIFRDGDVGVITADCYNEFVHRISNDDDEKYRVERTPPAGDKKMSEVLKHPNDKTLLSEYIRNRRTDRLDEWSMDALANNVAAIESQLAAVTQELEQLKQSSVVMPEVMQHCIYSKVFRSLKAHGFVVGDFEIRDIYQAIRQALATNDKEKDSE